MEACWDRADLERRLCRALEIAAAAVGRLAVSGYRDPIIPDLDVIPAKVITETAMLLLAVHGVAEPGPLAVSAAGLARDLIAQARSARMRLALCLRPALAPEYGLAHACLQCAGYPDPGFDRLLRHALRAQAQRGHERVPYRVLEAEWVRRMTDARQMAVTSRHWDAAMRAGVLAYPVDLVGGTREDGYALTHALMYATNLGTEPPDLPRPVSAVLAEAEALLAHALDDEDYDLGGELILAWPLTGTSWNATAAFGFQVLAGIEDQVGFVPSAATRLDRLEALEGEDRGRYLTATAYHTAYVMGLLCAASLRPERAPPRKLPAPRGKAGAVAALLPLLEDGSRPRHWQDKAARLPEAERQSLGDFLVAVALRRRIAAHDFRGVADILKIASAMGLADTPAASQAAEMLGELAREPW